MSDDGWAELATELAAVIPRLHDGDTLILESDGRYVQLRQGRDTLVAEATANHFLPPERRLGPEGERHLARLGWQPPDQDNWWRRQAWPVRSRDAVELAELLVATLRDVFEVRRAADLRPRSFDAHRPERGSTVELAALRARH